MRNSPVLRLAQGIAESTHGFKQATGAAGLNFASQLKNEYVNGIPLDIAIDSPNRLDEVISGYDPAGSAHEVFEKNELRACQDQQPFPAMNLMGPGVQRQIG